MYKFSNQILPSTFTQGTPKDQVAIFGCVAARGGETTTLARCSDGKNVYRNALRNVRNASRLRDVLLFIFAQGVTLSSGLWMFLQRPS